NQEGVTIIQVTHSEKNAQYGSRLIELEDGFIRKDESLQSLNSHA
ncbi:MAG: ABC transporter ATP-binding protein, partial [Bacteroidota bacterium]